MKRHPIPCLQQRFPLPFQPPNVHTLKDYPHEQYTVGFAADGSPSFYINTDDNTEGMIMKNGGDGGVGKAYTISDGTTSVYYAGGGGGAFEGGGRPGAPKIGIGGQGGGGQGSNEPLGTQWGTGTVGTANRGGGGEAEEQK